LALGRSTHINPFNQIKARDSSFDLLLAFKGIIMSETEIVYVLINAAMPGLVKIGVTSQSDIEIRLKQLYTTGVPVPFECYYACRVSSEKKVEENLHFAFSSHRINPNREFFKIEPEKVKAILEMLRVDDVTREVERELENDSNESDKIAMENIKRKRPVMNFDEMDIPVGSTLVFKDGVTSVTVADQRRVIFQGAPHYLTWVTQQVMGIDRPIQPSPYWSFNGKSISQIYNETYPEVD
jgi:hypothetical protein